MNPFLNTAIGSNVETMKRYELFLDVDIWRIINNRSDKEMKEFSNTSYHVFEARVTFKIPPHLKFVGLLH